MTKRINFTRARLEKFAPETSKVVSVYDESEPGLCIRVTPGNAKTFYLYRKLDGRPERVKLGRFPDITIEQARDAARVYKGKYAQGINIAVERRKTRSGMTVGETFDRYLTDYAKLRKRSWKDDEGLFRRYVEHWRPRKLAQIQKADAQQLHTDTGRKFGPIAANRMVEVMRKVYNFATTIGYEGENPFRGIKRFKETSRERFIQPDELARFFAALGKCDEVWQDFFKLLLFTGARRGNALAAEWGEINFGTRIWEVPAEKSKVKKPLRICLSEPALEILRRRWGARQQDCQWVFPSYGKAGHLIEPKMVWAEILADAKIKDLRIHDLRRTLGSWMTGTGANLQMIGKQLGHGNDSRATAVYARLNIEPVAAAVNIAAEAMLKASAAPKK